MPPTTCGPCAATTVASCCRCAPRWASSNTKWTAAPTASGRTTWNPSWSFNWRDWPETEFKIQAEDCAELFAEGVIYYYRYVRFFQLRDWMRTARDTTRNLRLFDLIRRYAKRAEDRTQLEQWRPYVVRVNAVSRAMMALDKQQFETALKIVREGIEDIEVLADMENPTFQFERDRSLTALRDLAEQIERDRPVSEIERLQRELRQAVESEQFERAAKLRDRLRALQPSPDAA